MKFSNPFKVLLTVVISFSQPALQAAEFDISDQIRALDFHKNSFARVFGRPALTKVKEFNEALNRLGSEKRKKALDFIAAMDPMVPEVILIPLTYWRYIEPNLDNQAWVLRYLGHSRLNILKDCVDNPNGLAPNYKLRAEQLLSVLTENAVRNHDLLFIESENFIRETAIRLTQIISDGEFLQNFKGSSLFNLDLWKEIPSLPKYSLSWHRFIPGNKVEVLSENQRDVERMQWVNERAIYAGGALDFSLPYMKMPNSGEAAGNIIWMDPIFKRIRDLVDVATDSIFIDIFLFGGTMGGTFAKYLIDEGIKKKARNPGFKMLLIHDYATNYNMIDEMLPIFTYIRDRIKNEKIVGEMLVLLQANIQRHRPGIPFGISDLIPKTDETFKKMEKMNTYYESKIDHSKVIVVDANTDHPKAYFGSKNWSDHSGAYYYDDAIYVEGPAAALVQNSYFDDIDAALTRDPVERKWFYYKDKGLANEHYLSRRDSILNWFKVQGKSYPAVGNDVLRIAEANVDGRIKDCRNILVDMINNAKDHIYMEQLFIYDKYIIDALMKRKRIVPGLQVKILADHNGNFGMNGFPNSMFLSEMILQGIEIKTRNTLGVEAVFKDGTKRSYHQENHRKITSVDGKVLLGGSSNLNYDTLQGSFREFGAQVFNRDEIGQFEAGFLSAWNDPIQTAVHDPMTTTLKLGKSELSLEQSKLFNAFGAMLIRSKDRLEKR
jgi:phosphatidylserine/phosphatidylglycerophosphate/cardiolipin synthase-like enzyme